MQCSVFNSRQRHDAALLVPETHQMLIELKTNWDDYSPWARGESLINLVLSGCSARGLADHLPCSASTIRSLMDLADLMPYLPEEDVNAIEAGASFTSFLRDWNPEQRARCHYERMPRFIERLAEEQAKPGYEPPALW